MILLFLNAYLENGLTDFNDFALILYDFERPFRWNQLVLALQFSFNAYGVEIRALAIEFFQLNDCPEF